MPVRTRTVACLGCLMFGALLLAACVGGQSSTRTGTTRPQSPAARRAAAIARLPEWEQTLVRTLLREPKVTTLPRIVPATGVALIIAGEPKDGPLIYLQPARLSRKDVTASVADSTARRDVGSGISNTVFGIGTIFGSDVMERPVWVVTIPTKPSAGVRSCGPFGSTCPSEPKVITSFVVVIDGASGQMLAGFQA